MERLFTEEIKSLRLGDGDTFVGENILAVTKALLQSGVSYVGGYQGAPVSHLLDVMVQAKDLMDELGVHVEACTNEASAAAMLGASINYPIRGAVTWKSIVGTNVAADALSNLSSPGVGGGTISTHQPLDGPPEFVYERLTHPPATFRQEKLKFGVRMPAARKFIVEHALNELFPGKESSIGIIVQGGLYPNLIRALQGLGLADAFGETQIPIFCLNCVYPLVPEQITQFCAGKAGVLIVEEGQPEFIELEIATMLRRADVQTPLHGKDILQLAGEYTIEVILRGLVAFLGKRAPQLDISRGTEAIAAMDGLRERAGTVLGAMPPRPPTMCTGCPERPFFAALSLAEREVGPAHVSGDIGCHALATFEPFSVGNSILGKTPAQLPSALAPRTPIRRSKGRYAASASSGCARSTTIASATWWARSKQRSQRRSMA